MDIRSLLKKINISNLLKDNRIGNILKNIYIRNLLGLILVIILFAFMLTFWLNHYTQHGEAVEVPNVKGLTVENAAELFEKNNLNYTVIDSVFFKGAIPGTVAETTPSIGSMVKEGRIVYLKVNAFLPLLITIPDVKNSSQRQSFAMLKSLGFENVSVKMVKGDYADLTVGLESKGSPLEAGRRVPADTPLSLLVSSGSSDIVPLGNSDDSIEITPDDSLY